MGMSRYRQNICETPTWLGDMSSPPNTYRNPRCTTAWCELRGAGLPPKEECSSYMSAGNITCGPATRIQCSN